MGGATISGGAVAESSFPEFADGKLGSVLGCSSFVTEPVGDALTRNPHAAGDIRR
jgi:hypothetical protein